LEDEGDVAGVCAEEDGEGLTFSFSRYIKEQGVSRVDAEYLVQL